MTQDMKVEIKSRKRVFDSFFKIDEVHLRHQKFDGTMSKEMRRLNFERGDSVAALLWCRETDKLILINQFRYPAYEKGPGWLLEVVAGVLDKKDGTPEEAVRREILEETGYRTTELTKIATFYVSPGGTSERIMLYFAEVTSLDKIEDGGGIDSEHEDIRVEYFTWDEVRQLMDEEKIPDAKTLIALQWFQLNKKKCCD